MRAAKISKEEYKRRQKVWRDKNYQETRAEKIAYSVAYGKAMDPEKRSRDRLRTKYGLSEKEYEGLLIIQKYKCAICDYVQKINATGKARLAVDHNHKTGVVRGLLCNKCNRGIGLLQDSIQIVTKALKYLTNETISNDPSDHISTPD